VKNSFELKVGAHVLFDAIDGNWRDGQGGTPIVPGGLAALIDPVTFRLLAGGAGC
jgi:hypothetical protein